MKVMDLIKLKRILKIAKFWLEIYSRSCLHPSFEIPAVFICENYQIIILESMTSVLTHLLCTFGIRLLREEKQLKYARVYDYIHANYSPLDHGQIRELILLTDRCLGKNKIIFALFTLMNLVRQNYFTSFSHKFFMMGYSYNDCDRDYSQIEKNNAPRTS